jgi:hypothetical protein
MSRPVTLVMLVLAAALALPACSSGGTASHPAATRPTHTPAPASPVPASSTPAAVLHVGEQVLIFDAPLPSDPAQAAVIRDFRQAQVLWVRSQTAYHLVAPVRSYIAGTQLRRIAPSIRRLRSMGDVPAGTDRMFQTRVTLLSARRADVSTCDDTSGLGAKNLATGQLDPRFIAPPNQRYLYENWHMTQLGAHWAITGLTFATLPDPRAKPCQP